jgi:hypothetical protein
MIINILEKHKVERERPKSEANDAGVGTSSLVPRGRSRQSPSKGVPIPRNQVRTGETTYFSSRKKRLMTMPAELTPLGIVPERLTATGDLDAFGR